MVKSTHHKICHILVFKSAHLEHFWPFYGHLKFKNWKKLHTPSKWPAELLPAERIFTAGNSPLKNLTPNIPRWLLISISKKRSSIPAQFMSWRGIPADISKDRWQKSSIPAGFLSRRGFPARISGGQRVTWRGCVIFEKKKILPIRVLNTTYDILFWSAILLGYYLSRFS